MRQKNKKYKKMIPYEKPKLKQLSLNEKGFGGACNPGQSAPGFLCKSGGTATVCNIGSNIF